MNNTYATIVTDELPWARLGGHNRNIPAIHFGPVYGGSFDVQLPVLMPADRKVEWCQSLSDQLLTLAVEIAQAEATLNASLDEACT